MRQISALLLCCVALGLCAQEPATLKLVQTIPLPGVKGRFDHFAIDADGRRLFVAALGNNTLEVIDLVVGKRLKTITGPRKPQGVLFLAEQNQIVVAGGDDGTVKFFEGASYELVRSVGSLDDADNLRFDTATKRIYVGYGDGALGVIDAAKLERLADIQLKGHPESFQFEKNGNRIFVNVPDAKQVAVIDREKQLVAATWPMEKFQANFPMALDEANHRLFVGCRQPARLVVLDTSSGKFIADLKLSGDTDDLFYDAKRNRIYASCGEGFLDVIEQRDANRYERHEQIPTRGGARTSFYSADLDELFLAVPQRDGREAELRIYQPR